MVKLFNAILWPTHAATLLWMQRVALHAGRPSGTWLCEFAARPFLVKQEAVVNCAYVAPLRMTVIMLHGTHTPAAFQMRHVSSGMTATQLWGFRINKSACLSKAIVLKGWQITKYRHCAVLLAAVAVTAGKEKREGTCIIFEAHLNDFGTLFELHRLHHLAELTAIEK
jgi:hypothetical protein